MLSALDVARYFLGKDIRRKLFDKVLREKNGRTFYVGNARLNKYLHIAQNLYIAKTGRKLFADDLYAYDNGAVVPQIQESYSVLVSRRDIPQLDSELSLFLDRIFLFLKNATLDELIELSHEDPEWEAKHRRYLKADQKMDSLRYAEVYQAQYADALKILESMPV